jgi:hypothetical protein
VALPRVLGMEKMLWLSKDQVREVAKDSRYPAAYQLLPPRGEPFVWDEDSSGEYQPLDIYDPDVSGPLQLSEASLNAAQTFHQGLDVTKRPPGVRYFCFAGTRQTTATVARVLRQAPKYRLRKVELESAGDGTVPFWSSTLSGLQNLAVGGEHSVLYKNGDLRRTLGFLLGAPGVLAATPERIDVVVRERVCEPQDSVHAILTLAGGATELDGEIRVERAEMLGIDRIGPFRPTGPAKPIRYRGLAADTLGVVFNAPTIPGIYRVAYYSSGQPEPLGSDELFVQEPPG